mmetsp:Transcript_18307/g.62177  ORF Transcript_18307/g.62177 Transcript_18307/m.62177 type:complete len:372 (+) Transcript_18307:503-1618(+)
MADALVGARQYTSTKSLSAACTMCASTCATSAPVHIQGRPRTRVLVKMVIVSSMAISAQILKLKLGSNSARSRRPAVTSPKRPCFFGGRGTAAGETTAAWSCASVSTTSVPYVEEVAGAASAAAPCDCSPSCVSIWFSSSAILVHTVVCQSEIASSSASLASEMRFGWRLLTWNVMMVRPESHRHCACSMFTSMSSERVRTVRQKRPWPLGDVITTLALVSFGPVRGTICTDSSLPCALAAKKPPDISSDALTTPRTGVAGRSDTFARDPHSSVSASPMVRPGSSTSPRAASTIFWFSASNLLRSSCCHLPPRSCLTKNLSTPRPMLGFRSTYARSRSRPSLRSVSMMESRRRARSGARTVTWVLLAPGSL